MCTVALPHRAGRTRKNKGSCTSRRLTADFDLLEGILKDEKLVGFNTVYDQYGGFTTNPLISDIQDDRIFEEIYQEMKRRVSGTTDLQMQPSSVARP
jgi:hypothetical protein